MKAAFSILLSLNVILGLGQPIFIKMSKVDLLNNQVTIRNMGSQTIDVSDYTLCVNGTADTIGNLTIVQGNYDIPSADSLTVSINLPVAGDLGFYRIETCGIGSFMEHYIQWGSTGNNAESIADQYGYWQIGDSLSLADCYIYNPPGTVPEEGVDDWIIVGGSVGIPDLDDYANFSVFPNPVGDVLTIHQATSAKSGYEIRDISGRYIRYLHPGEVQVDVSNLQSGIYFLSSIETRTSIKFVKN